MYGLWFWYFLNGAEGYKGVLQGLRGFMVFCTGVCFLAFRKASQGLFCSCLFQSFKRQTTQGSERGLKGSTRFFDMRS